MAKKSQAWKAFERETAELYRSVGFSQAYRVSRGDDIGVSDTDVRVPELPTLQIDTKYRKDGWSVVSLFKDVEAKYCPKGSKNFLVLPLKCGGKAGSHSVIRSEILAELIAYRYLGQQDRQGLKCPRCQDLVGVYPPKLGLSFCECPSCGMSIFIGEGDIPKGTAFVSESNVIPLNSETDPSGQEAA